MKKRIVVFVALLFAAAFVLRVESKAGFAGKNAASTAATSAGQKCSNVPQTRLTSGSNDNLFCAKYWDVTYCCPSDYPYYCATDPKIKGICLAVTSPEDYKDKSRACNVFVECGGACPF